MKIAVLALVGILSAFLFPKDFLDEQNTYERVRIANQQKRHLLIESLKKENILPEELNLLFIAYKDESLLEIYAKKTNENDYKKFLTYDICRKSGKLGPKKRAGDLQVPEGFYHIDRFNPASTYYLSLGLNYPNQADKQLWKSANPGSDIFIHGYCVTLGCLPMTNDKIQEIYLYAIQARNNGQVTIPVYIFPFRMTNQNLRKYKEIYKNDVELIRFWDNLKTGYDRFEKNKKELCISVNKNGRYTF